jgi:adenylate cyclase
MAITYLSCEAYRNLVEEKKSRFLHKAFSSYISPELVSEIVKNPELLKLGGEKREITMLFSDIRGFTTVSEKVPPEAIVKILNGYLGPMTNIVLNHKGTLDKYMGDAIMAIYNAPLEIKNHPLLACKTAIDMMEALKNVNKGFKEVGFPEIDIGIGINTGEAIVGNMGTNVRFDYTAIGDVVNLSSRLEGLNKQYHTHIIVSESTKEKTDKNFRFRELDKIKVKGKEVPVAIYELDKALDNKLIDRFAEALAFYRSNNFTEALALFVTLEKEYNDKVSLVFSERCREFLKNPPSPDWDGVYVAKTK